MARLNLNDNGTNICWDFTNLYGGTMIFPGDSGYLKMGNCLMSYSKRESNALIKFDYTDTLQIKYANHGSTMTLNTQGTAYAGVTAQLWGNSSRPVVYEVGVDGGAYMFYAQKTTSNTYELTVNGACNASAFNQGSDRDLKDNIQVIDNAINRIRKMNGYTYTLKENGMPYAGVIAQETLEAIPEAVGSMMKYPDGGSGLDGEEGERYYTVDYSGVTGLLVQVARESDDRITALEEENAELRQRLSAIEAALASK
ncbi:TPA: tail fiber domain-containing protein [Escherichia coli]|nr:tail fiber domain-containing protein [Escherichia coli]